MNGRGKLALVTGGSRGLGFGAAKKLAERGFRVRLTARTESRAEAAAAHIRGQVAGADVRGMALDLTSFAAVRACADQIMAAESSLPLLIANAANLPEKRPQYTAEGHEATFAANHLGHFLLVTRLLPLLEAAAQGAGEARVVVVSSRLHRPGSMGPEVHFAFDDLAMRRDYRPMVAYKNSKLANLWFTYALDQRVHGSGITANALCPGFVPETMAAEAHGIEGFLYRSVLAHLPIAHTVDEATETYLYVATDPRLRGIGSRFYGECREIASSAESYNVKKAAQLWQVSEELTAG